MGLLRGMARTAVIAGTATAVSNRVSRRQQARWAAEDREAAGYAQQAAYTRPADEDDLTAALTELTGMRERGQLTEAEFAAAKSRLLGI
jgi:hypothetical protein